MSKRHICQDFFIQFYPPSYQQMHGSLVHFQQVNERLDSIHLERIEASASLYLQRVEAGCKTAVSPSTLAVLNEVVDASIRSAKVATTLF